MVFKRISDSDIRNWPTLIDTHGTGADNCHYVSLRGACGVDVTVASGP